MASTIGGSAASMSRMTFGVSSMPNQMTSRLKYARGGSARTKVTPGSRIVRLHLLVPSRSPSGTPTTIANAEAMRMRRMLAQRCS